jgi:hypothetical protein
MGFRSDQIPLLSLNTKIHGNDVDLQARLEELVLQMVMQIPSSPVSGEEMHKNNGTHIEDGVLLSQTSQVVQSIPKLKSFLRVHSEGGEVGGK